MMPPARQRPPTPGLAALCLLLLLAAVPLHASAPGRVTALRLQPGAGQTELIIQVEGGQVEWSDFALAEPARIVVDLVGVRSALPSERFDGVNRGGVRALRTSQNGADVVRVVVDLERASRYRVERVAEGVRVSLGTGDVAFAPWSSVGGAPAAGATAARPTQPQPRAARRITVSFQEADIRDVLASFAEFTGRSIVVGAGVSGTVTAEITNQPWDVALESILRAQGLAARDLPTGIIQVDAMDKLKARAESEPLLTRTIRANYVPAQELVATLEPLKTERGSVVANPTTNTLVVSDVESVVSAVQQLVSQLDVPTPQVTIQAKLVFINQTDAEQLGFRYDLKDSRGNQLNRITPGFNPVTREAVPTGTNLVRLGGNSIAALGNAENRITGATLETMMSLVLGRYTLISFIDALQSAELANVQAAPLITTLDNREAYILVGERTPIRVIDLGGGAGATGGTGGGVQIPRATAELVETGIKLTVTPHITGDRRVLLQLRAENSSAQPAAGEFGVQFQTQESATRLLVNDGETAVIGGLTVTRVTRRRVGIPFLMSLPVVGVLFRQDTKEERKQDLLIMVTPHIVNERA